MKKHNIMKVVLIALMALVLLTWIIPAAYFSNSFIDQGRVQMGLFDLFNYPVTAISYFGYIAFFVLMVGGFYGIMYKIPAYRNFLDRAANLMKRTGFFSLSIFVVVIAIVTSICGLQFGLILFFPMIISIILLMGYDKIIAALVVVGSTMIGMIGTTYAHANVYIIPSVLALDDYSKIGVKWLILLVGIALLIVNIFLYLRKSSHSVVVMNATTKDAKKVKPVVVESNQTTKVEKTVNNSSKNNKKSNTSNGKTTKSSVSKKTTTTKSSSKSSGSKKSNSSKSSRKDIKAAVKGDDIIVIKDGDIVNDALAPVVTSEKHKIWPIVVTVVFSAIVMILAFIPWSEPFGITAFNDATSKVLDFSIFDFPLFGKILGNVNSFGAWTIVDLTVVMAFVILFLSLIYKVKFNEVLDGFFEGIKKVLPVAVIVILLYTCLVVVTYHPFQLTIYKALIGTGTKLNVGKVFTNTFAAILASVFNVEPLYAFQSILPYLTSVVTKTSCYPLIGIIYQTMYGFAMLFAPTSVILMGTLSYLGVSYGKWLKAIWKLLVALFVLLLVIFIIML